MYQDVDRRYTFPLSGFGRFPGKSYSNNVPSYTRKFPFERASRSMLKQVFNRFLHRFLMIFECLLVANLPPTWRPRRARTAPGATQEASKIEEKWSSDAKTLPRSIWMRFWMDFGTNLGGFWMDFGSNLVSLDFGSNFDPKCLHGAGRWP